MFEDALLESTARARRSRRGLTTLLSAAVQAGLVGLAILLPLLYTDALPAPEMRTTVYAPLAAGPRQPRVTPLADPPAGRRGGATLEEPSALTAPPRIPRDVATIFDSAPVAEAPDVSAVGVGGPRGGDGVAGALDLPGPASPGPRLKPPPPAEKPNVSEGVMEGLLIRRVQPVYPQLAIITRTEGEVLLQATISREGVIENLQVVSGHPLLVPAATDAVRQWRYRPYRLNRVPVEVETQIRIVFKLNR